MMLGELIARLEREKQDAVLPLGFGAPMSYRGYYEDVAFGPRENVTVASMLAHARSAVGTTFEGYKGGDFMMTERTRCWIAHYGDTGDMLSDLAIDGMIFREAYQKANGDGAQEAGNAT